MNERPNSSEVGSGERSQVPARWIDTIRFTLADIIARGEWDDFGIFRILNRVSFVCRNHLMFVVGFRRELGISKTGGGKEIIYGYEASPLISSLDPEFSDIAFEALYRAKILGKIYSYEEVVDSKTKRIPLESEATVNYAIPVWGSKVFVLAMELHVAKGSIGQKPDMHLNLVSISSKLGGFIAEALKPFDGAEAASEHHPELFSSRMFLPRGTAEKGLMLLRRTLTLQRAADDYPEHLDEWQRSIIQSAIADVEKLVEDEYIRLRRSPLLNSNLENTGENEFKPITNVSFFGKVFDAEKIRYKHYRYNAHPLISEAQWKDIRQALERARREDFIPFDNGSIDNQFWRNAGTNEGRARIERAIRAPISSHARLFAESVLMSGTTLIKPGVFARGAIGWLDAKAPQHERNRAIFYLACLHFVLQLGSPVRPVDAQELSLVVLPFRCSGGIWMCAAYVRDNRPGPIHQLVDQKRFEESALIYHSLFRETERRLRRRARGRYTDALGKLIAKETVATRWRKNDDAILCLDADSRDSFTQNMRLLTRVYPFDGVELVASDNDRDILPFTEIAFKSRPNGYFDRLTLHGFLREGENLRRLRERILLASVLVDEEDHE